MSTDQELRLRAAIMRDLVVGLRDECADLEIEPDDTATLLERVCLILMDGAGRQSAGERRTP